MGLLRESGRYKIYEVVQSWKRREFGVKIEISRDLVGYPPFPLNSLHRHTHRCRTRPLRSPRPLSHHMVRYLRVEWHAGGLCEEMHQGMYKGPEGSSRPSTRTCKPSFHVHRVATSEGRRHHLNDVATLDYTGHGNSYKLC